MSYAVNKSGEFGRIDTKKGAVSCVAWYIFTKNVFDPMSLSFTDIITYNTTGIQQSEKITSKEYNQYTNYPNPFNTTTTISYPLPNPAYVELKIYNIPGQEILTLVSERKFAGDFYICWDGKNKSGHAMPSGVYSYRIKVGDFVKSYKMILMR